MATTLSVLLDADKVKAIRSKLGDRTSFETNESGSAFEQAVAHIDKAAAETSNFHDVPAFMGQGLETAHRIVVATVGVRDKESKKNGYKAIVIFSQPTIADFLADESEEAKAFVAKLVEREATDVAFSGIRTADTDDELKTVMTGLPISIADIVTVSRASGGVGDSIFGDYWADFRKGVLAAKYPGINAALPQKPEFIKALRSASYAKANPETAVLEGKDYIKKIGEMFVAAVQKIAPDEDTTLVQEWINGRDTLNLDYNVKVIKADELEVLEL